MPLARRACSWLRKCCFCGLRGRRGLCPPPWLHHSLWAHLQRQDLDAEAEVGRELVRQGHGCGQRTGCKGKKLVCG